jgi:hypothetical protein
MAAPYVSWYTAMSLVISSLSLTATANETHHFNMAGMNEEPTN